jgi:serine/threonine protein kinase
MASEQFKRQPLDSRTDLYALACILYVGLTGMRPFQGDDPAEIMKAHLQARVIPVNMMRRDFPQSLCEWLMRMLARDADERPKDAEAALEALLESVAIAQETAAHLAVDQLEDDPLYDELEIAAG